MYNTLMHNCTNEVSREVEAMSTIDFPITYKTILPGFFDEVLYSVGVIDTSEPFEELRRASLVNNALVDEEDEDFAVHVRQMVGK
jgi:L-ribulose-5-phosphate 3-epimerase UlaE